MLKGESSGCACCLKPHPPNRRDAPLLSVTESPEIEGKLRHTPSGPLTIFPHCDPHALQVGLFRVSVSQK